MDMNNAKVDCKSNLLPKTVIYEKQEMRTERFFSKGIERWDDHRKCDLSVMEIGYRGVCIGFCKETKLNNIKSYGM